MADNKPSFLQKVNDWVNERIPVSNFINSQLHEQIIGGTRFSYTLGSACLFLLILQIVTGVWQMFYYVPTVDYAYASVSYLRFQVPWGWLIHGLHFWGGNAFSIVIGLHAMRVFIWGAYKKPREIVWLAGVCLILMAVGFMFTGPVLAWDKKGFWAGQVGLGITGTVPFVGPFLKNLLQGASQMGQIALLRLFVMHVAIIPFLTGIFVMIHLIAFRQHLSVGPWDEKKRNRTGDFWPEQLFKDMIVSLGIFVLLVGLCAYFPADVTGQADPMDTLYTPKPEWNFFFIYEVLKYFPGVWEPLGTAGIPLIILLLFFSLPFLDRSPERNPFKRGFVLLCGAAFVAFVLTFTYIGATSHPDPKEVIAVVKGGKSKMTLHEKIEMANADQNITGEKLFNTLGCTECHTVSGRASSKQGPDLFMAKQNNRTTDWLRTQIMYPQTHNHATIMPPYAHLSRKNIDLLVSYLQNLKPTPSPDIVTAPAPNSQQPSPANLSLPGQASGEQLFNTQGCVQCHTLQGHKTMKAGPDLLLAMVKDKPSRDWLRDQLMNPQSHNPTSIMPSYATRMNEEQINAVLDFLQGLQTRKLPTASAETAESEEESSEGAKTGVGEAAGIVGNKEHGAVLFQQSCIMCHGPQGKTRALNFPNPPKGVPTLNPIDRAVFSEDPATFAEHIDVFIQHGIPNTEGGPNMPSFGDTHALTQAQIADIEAYVLHLNGVDRAKIMNPGMEPKEFFFLLVELTLVIMGMAATYWFIQKYLKI